MRYVPHDYQTQATRFILDHPQAAVLLGMGLGKTVITLTAINELMVDEFSVSRVLIVAPLRVAKTTWPQEITKWDHLTHLTYALATGSRQQRINALSKDAMVTIINRENITWLTNHYGNTWPYDMVVIDELSSFKNHQAKRFKSLLRVRPKIERIVGLTGTPASNGLIDLWAQFRLLDEGKRLGRFIGHYRAAFFEPDKRNATQVFTYKIRPGAEHDIYQAIGDITLSMKTTDHLHLPPLTHTNTYVEMSPSEERLYATLKKDMVLALAGEVIDASNAAALSNKLTQMASGAVYTRMGETITVHSRKLDALEDMIEAANGQSLLVCYWYNQDLTRIKTRFPLARVLATSRDIQEWNNGDIALGLIHPASAGHGLNLQNGGSYLVWYSLPWSLELYQQANARLYRHGQTRPVTISHIITKNSIDEAIMSALEAKNTTQDALIEAVTNQLHTER